MNAPPAFKPKPKRKAKTIFKSVPSGAIKCPKNVRAISDPKGLLIMPIRAGV